MYPHERSLVEKLQGRPFALLGVNSDKDLATVKDAMRSEDLTWRSWWDGSTQGPISKFYNVRGWPTIYVIDPQGVIRYKNVRGDALEAALERLVEEAEAAGPRALAEYPVQGLGPELREWIDSTGKHRVKAAFVVFKNSSVHLEAEDGRNIQLPMSRLSKNDQQYIRDLLRERARAKAPKRRN